MRFVFFLGLLFLLPTISISQTDSVQQKKLVFTGDFRFRVEQDWNNRKPNGTYYDNRSRLRYRLRFGATYYLEDWAEFGTRIRTGYREKQQDPQLTLGDGFNEFGTVPIGFEKLYFKATYKNFGAWLGKNTFPFEKQNELFWSDNVFPDGVFLNGSFPIDSKILQNIKVNAGHFIMNSSGKSFNQDQYFQGFQVVTSHLKNKVIFYPSFYYFHKMPNIPDGNQSYFIDYSILHLGAKATVVERPNIQVSLDYYSNLVNHNQNDSIPQQFRNQKKGVVGSIKVGKLAAKGDWAFSTTIMYLEKYAIVDFLAQNDWTRWDYSSQGSPDGRLSNYKGTEFSIAYLIRKNFRLKARYFIVEQLIPFGIITETGNRVRLDLDIGF